ncbi:MAG: 16S rRNA (cytidine(1402)-2'-O)-methyltransferase [Sphingobium sp.]|jgi:16S rRNA (cytidine1402-2'-O)-methyltransferase|nr:16S rRNA (cytidine(1402)-2'-O)-methyltransferase [Sphingobium sp.]MCI1271182.1 16S rRNA (cytidine(1402)-2'-O)-methyltransferase [Sphingobium sp.]MCI1754780.1 16S rRNA (cytidine(1402)-2'-O)-methyltransferase [Sphingobium sp.]MCI2053046.1 16S rRNA (cytidine(1402)-2'-O)-methyltransferase [Sphingobium sp.]
MVEALSPGLYIVAGPIGNLSDLSPRAADILCRADVVAVEDSRVSARLLRHAGSDRPMLPYHDHSDEAVRARLVARMEGEAVALLSDAGTPLISDPGYKLVRDARAAGRAVTTIPGPCAAVAALTVSGLPTDRFLFMGFLPAKAKARGDALAEVAGLRASLVFYESGPRLSASLSDMVLALGDREACVAREITKLHEEARTGMLSDLARHYADAPPKGEIVVVVGPPGETPAATEADADALLVAALGRLSVGKAASEVAKATGLDRRTLYARALEIRAISSRMETSGGSEIAATIKEGQ